MTAQDATLASRMWPVTETRGGLRAVILAVIGSIFVAVCAQVSVPMVPVPMTMQTFGVLAVGAAYGSRLGALTLALYLIEGAVGLPVFANFQAGLFLPSGQLLATLGYLVGFIAAAWIAGWFAERGRMRGPVAAIAAMLVATAAVYIPGLAWLAGWIAQIKGLDVWTALSAAIGSGLLPFVPGDILKAVLAASALPAVSTLLDRRG